AVRPKWAATTPPGKRVRGGCRTPPEARAERSRPGPDHPDRAVRRGKTSAPTRDRPRARSAGSAAQTPPPPAHAQSLPPLPAPSLSIMPEGTAVVQNAVAPRVVVWGRLLFCGRLATAPLAAAGQPPGPAARRAGYQPGYQPA